MIAMRDATCGVGCVGGGGESRWKSRRCEHESWRRRTEQRQSWRDWCSIPEPLPCAAPQVLCSSGLMMISAAELLYTVVLFPRSLSEGWMQCCEMSHHCPAAPAVCLSPSV